MKKYACLLGVLALCLSFVTGAYAQEQSGAIQGTVKDAQGGVLPGVTVEVKNQATGAVQSTVSDASGIYRFPSRARVSAANTMLPMPPFMSHVPRP